MSTAVQTALPAAAQINARIAPELKARGDAALLNAGFSPTQAIRALWDFAAEHFDDPDVIARALLPEQTSDEDARAAEEKAQRAEAIAYGPSLVRDAYLKFGLVWPLASELSYDDLKELAYAERYGDELGWS